MKLKGKISILINRESTTIEIEDDVASTTFCKITLTPQQLSDALSRLSSVECVIEAVNLDRVGKKHEWMTFDFEIPESMANSNHENELQKLAQSQLSDGWIAGSYFSSQKTFFKKDGKQYASVTCRRYI